ncbi:MAG TPA: amino acid ABC transporter permease [Burkholderiaceae bacterium]|nr:amino acid ABC transporter permease [Burkholderiaceae bacterium]
MNTPGVMLILSTLLAGALTALKIAIGAAMLAFLLGLLLALSNVFARAQPARLLIGAYVEWMRNVPALAHLFILYFGLAELGIQLSPMTAAITGLGLVGAAVLCDVFSAGIRSLHVGQREAALAAGLTPLQALQSVILPQMLSVTLPALGNYTTQLIKDTAIASAIAAPEIMFYARNLVTSTFQTPLIYGCAILLYASVIYPVNWAFGGLERRLGASR